MYEMFINHVPNIKYWITKMNKGNGDTTLRLKYVILLSITMIRIKKNNKLPMKFNNESAKN